MYLQRDGQHKAIILSVMDNVSSARWSAEDNYLQHDGQHKAIIFSVMVSIRQLY